MKLVSHYSSSEKSWQSHVVPTDWKRGNVNPHFEKRKKVIGKVWIFLRDGKREDFFPFHFRSRQSCSMDCCGAANFQFVVKNGKQDKERFIPLPLNEM